MGDGENPHAAAARLVTQGLVPREESSEAPAQGEQPTEVEAQPVQGQEGGDQIEGEPLAEQLGVEPDQLKPATNERFKELLAELKTAKEEREVLMRVLEGRQPTEAEPEPEAVPTPQGQWMSVPELDFDDDDYMTGAQAKQLLAAVAEAANGGMGVMGQQLIGTIAPLFKDTVQAKVDREWQEIESDLGKLGVSRSQVEPLVQEMQKRDPSRTLRGMAFDAASQVQVKPTQPQSIPSVQEPGAGRPAAPQAEPKEAPVTRDDLLRKAIDGANKVDATHALAQALVAGMDRSRTRSA